MKSASPAQIAGFRPIKSESGPNEKLTDPQPKEEGRDDQLNVVALRSAKVAPDIGQGGQHRVDRERDERHQQGDEGYEFAGAEHGPPGRPLDRVAGHLPVGSALAVGSLLSGIRHRPLWFERVRQIEL